ncbi:MAG TPA: PAS domain S-box protein [Devosia sp.]|nr:PAS domain S-box protein [Devosia sp.]
MHAERSDAQLFRFDQSGALLRKVMESAAVGMALVGADGRMIYANRAYETMLGYADDACLGLSVDDMLYPEDGKITGLHLARLMRGEADEFHQECRLKHVDGGPIWVLASGSLLRSDTTGRPLYVIVQIINIERQKRAEAALAETESRWNFALESAGQGVWDHDIRKDDMFYSPMWRKMRGIPEGEYVDPAQDLWLARLHPDDARRIKAIVKKQDAGEDGYDTLEYRERHRDGHYIWILSRGKPVEWDRDGNPIRTIGTDTDITRLKAVEAELADEKERLRVTLESIGDGVICTDAEENIIFMNPVAEQMTGWNEADAMGRAISDVFIAKSEATGAPARDPVASCLDAGMLCTIDDDVVLAARDGAGRGVAGTASPVRTEDGHTIGAVLVFKDITETQELQRALAHSANHDALTGLPNRIALARALAEAHRQVGEERRMHALCFIDLDRFKPVNDTAGHAAGDALLQEVAQVIRRTCRNHDMAARLGGDEFVVLLADCTLANARAVAEKIVEAISKLDFAWNGTAYSMGASAGIAMIRADRAQDALAEADAACYSAKAAGRGRVATAAA